MSLYFVLISFKYFPESCSFLKVSANHLLNLSFMMPFTQLLAVNRGLGNRQAYHLEHIWNIFGNIFSLNNNVTSSVFDLEKRPILKVQIEQVFLFFSVPTYDMTVSSRCFKTF